MLIAAASFIVLLPAQPVRAASNANLNFQARLQTNNGGIVPDGFYNVQFNLYDTSSGGASLWTETYLNSASQGIRVKNGYLTVNLGSLTAFPNTINWDQELWIGLTVRGTTSCTFTSCTPADAEMSPRLKLTGVPYAFRAGMLATGNGTLQSTLQLLQPTGGNQTFRIRDQAAGGTYSLLTENEANANYIQNTTSPQTANFNVTGNGTVGGNLAISGTYNGNTFTGSSLAFGTAGAATIQSANGQSLTVNSGTTGALNLGTGANAKSISLGNTTGATSVLINAGTGNINLRSAASTIIRPTANSASTFQVQDANGITELQIDTNVGQYAFGANGIVSGARLGVRTTGSLDILRLLDQDSNPVFVTGNTGDVQLRPSINSTTAFNIQDASGYTVVNIDTANRRLIARAQTDSAVHGSEMMTGSFPATAGWTAISGSGQTATATHSSGTTSLSPSSPAITPTVGTRYRVMFTISNYSTGSLSSVSFAGTSYTLVAGNGVFDYTVGATTTANLVFTPSSGFNGTISGVSVRSVASTVSPLALADASGSVAAAFRVNDANANSLFMGLSAGIFSGGGVNNTGVGASSLQDGFSGSNNTGIGFRALFKNGSGSDNSALGSEALGNLISGSQNTAVGSGALVSVRGGSYNSALGYYAGNQDSAGFGSSVNATNVTVLGYQAQSQVSNALILGGAGVLDATGSSAVRVGIGTPRPQNLFSVMPTQYDTGTITQSGNTVTGSGTTFTADMVGSRLLTAPGSAATITAFTNATTLTVSNSQTISSATAYRIHRQGFQITETGDVGVGVLTPTYRLDVATAEDNTYAARIRNTSTASTADGLLIDLGITNTSRGTGNYFIGFAGNGTVAGKIQGCVNGAACTGGGTGPGVSYSTTGADYAEFFRANPAELPETAELVQIDTTNANGVVRSGSNGQRNIVGAISSNPGFVGNGPLCLENDEDCDANYAKYNALVALSGQVPVKVNASKGAIIIGDPITVSAMPGEGSKATAAGYIVGYAQEALLGDTGTIKVLIRPQYYTPPATPETANRLNELQAQIDSLGSTLNTGNLQAINLTVTGNAYIKGNLTVGGVTNLNELRLSGHLITKGSAPTLELRAAAGRGSGIKVEFSGNDTAGVVAITVGDDPQGDHLAKLIFNKPFETEPRIVLTPVGKGSAGLHPYVESPNINEFILGVVTTPQTGQTYRFTYHALQ